MYEAYCTEHSSPDLPGIFFRVEEEYSVYSGGGKVFFSKKHQIAYIGV